MWNIDKKKIEVLNYYGKLIINYDQHFLFKKKMHLFDII